MPDVNITTEQPMQPMTGVRRSAQWGDLMVALSKAQGEIEGAKKDSQNPHFKSSYADLASVMVAIREPLAKNGLAVTQWPRVIEGAVEIETILTHGEQFISDVLWMPCSKMDAHGIGSAITYGRRYALMAAVGVAPEDDDGNGAADGHKPGAPGTAGGGGDFRPAGPRRFQGNGNDDSDIERMTPPGWPRDESGKLMSGYKGKKALEAQKLAGERAATPAEARAAKIKAATDKRITALKDGAPWTRDGLDQFWEGDKEWIGWMADANNKSLGEYQRFTDAFAEAELNIKQVELA